MKCLGGLMKPSAGSVSLAGKNMTRLKGQELVELRQRPFRFEKEIPSRFERPRQCCSTTTTSRCIFEEGAEACYVERLEWRIEHEHFCYAQWWRAAARCNCRALITRPRLILRMNQQVHSTQSPVEVLFVQVCTKTMAFRS